MNSRNCLQVKKGKNNTERKKNSIHRIKEIHLCIIISSLGTWLVGMLPRSKLNDLCSLQEDGEGLLINQGCFDEFTIWAKVSYTVHVLHKLLPWIGFTSVHFISLLSWNLYTYVSDCSIYSHMLGFLLKESNKCRSQWPLFGSRHIPFKLHQWTKFNER